MVFPKNETVRFFKPILSKTISSALLHEVNTVT